MESGCAMSTPLEVFGDIVGGYQKGAAAKANAKLADMAAATVTDQAGVDEGRARRERSKLVGSQIAASGASGVTLDGSSASIIDDAVQSEMDALTIRYKGQVQATGYRNEARQLRLAGSQAIAGGYVQGAGSFLKGAERTIGAMGGR